VGPSQFLCDLALSRDLLVQEYPFSGAELIFNTAASIACHPKKISPKQKKSLAVTYGTFKTGHFSHTQSHWPPVLKVSSLCSGPSFAQIHWL
jgi:hypothetical protein